MSIKPGQSGFVTIDPAIGLTSSETLNPLTPVEFGRTVSGGVADEWTAGETPGTISIGTVSITGSSSQTVGSGSTYSATISGNADDAVYAWTTNDSSATISAASASSTDIEFSTSGSFTATCTVTSASSSPALVAGSKEVEVSAVALSISLTSSDFTDGSALSEEFGANFTGSFPVNPVLSWSLAGTNATDVVKYQLLCVDTDAANYVHWSVDNIGSDVLTIGTATNPTTSNWSGSPTVNETSGGANAAIGNGWEPVAPPGGETHNYRFQVQGFNSSNTAIVTSNLLTGTYTG